MGNMLSIKSLPLVSVIIPCYNSEDFIAEAIQSALDQDYENKEIIVINDGSTDGSLNIIKSFSEKIKFISQENQGRSEAKNTGIIASMGEYIAFLDSDDYWDKSFLKLMINAVVSKNVKLAYCGWKNIGKNKNNKPFIPPDYECKDNKIELMIESARWPIHAVVTHKSVFDYTGLFNPKYLASEDFAIWIRAATANKIARVDKVLAFYRHHDGEQITKQLSLTAYYHWLVQADFLKEHPEYYQRLGRKKIRKLTLGFLLKKGYDAYWKRDLKTAREIFLRIMRHFYGGINDWKYMLPSILPFKIHQWLVNYLDK